MTTIHYWMDQPLSAVPREELEQALVDAHRELAALRDKQCADSILHINTLAAVARERIRDSRPLIYRLFN